MLNKIKKLILPALLVVGVIGTVPLATVGAADLDPCTLDASSALCTDKETNVNNVFKTIVNVLLFLVAAIAVVMMIISGVRYTTSAGNANAVSGAKNTLLYSVIGLVVAIFAYAIVNFVVDQTSTKSSDDTSTTP